MMATSLFVQVSRFGFRKGKESFLERIQTVYGRLALSVDIQRTFADSIREMHFFFENLLRCASMEESWGEREGTL